jgi:hypothetical protein
MHKEKYSIDATLLIFPTWNATCFGARSAFNHLCQAVFCASQEMELESHSNFLAQPFESRTNMAVSVSSVMKIREATHTRHFRTSRGFYGVFAHPLFQNSDPLWLLLKIV